MATDKPFCAFFCVLFRPICVSNCVCWSVRQCIRTPPPPPTYWKVCVTLPWRERERKGELSKYGLCGELGMANRILLAFGVLTIFGGMYPIAKTWIASVNKSTTTRPPLEKLRLIRSQKCYKENGSLTHTHTHAHTRNQKKMPCFRSFEVQRQRKTIKHPTLDRNVRLAWST